MSDYIASSHKYSSEWFFRTLEHLSDPKSTTSVDNPYNQVSDYVTPPSFRTLYVTDMHNEIGQKGGAAGISLRYPYGPYQALTWRYCHPLRIVIVFASPFDHMLGSKGGRRDLR